VTKPEHNCVGADRVVSVLAAVVPAVFAVVAQLVLWPYIRPSVWFLFYPAVFLSSWVGGLRSAVVSALICAVAAIYLFLPPRFTFAVPPGQYLAAAVFITTGVLFGAFHERLRRANRRTEQALVSSEAANERLTRAIRERQLFGALIENSSDFIGIADPSGTPVYVNPAGRRMVGLRPDQPVEDTKIPEYYSADQRAFAESVIVKAMIEKGHWQGETEFRNWQTQQSIPVSDTHFMIRDHGTGETLGMGTVTRDISDIKRARDELEKARLELEQANEAIRQAHADLTRAQSVAKVGSWRLDVRRNELAWSDENYRIFEVPLGTPMTYGAFLACVHPEDRAQVDRAWTAALRGEPYDIEHRLLVDGRVKWVREKADLEFDEHGTLIGGIGITQDITERNQYEQELREARERFDLALRGADLGAWDWNIESGNVVFNARCAEIRGVRPEDASNHINFWATRIHTDDWPRIQKALDDHFLGRTTDYEIEYRARTTTGHWVWVFDRGKVFARDAQGKPTRMVGTELDITIRKRAEEELRRAEHEQRLLAEVGTLFASTLDYEQTLNTIARLATRELADFCIVDVIVAGAPRRQTIESRDPAGEAVCEMFRALQLDRSRQHLTRKVFETRKTVLTERLSPEMVDAFAQSEAHLRALRAMNPRSLILAPLLVHGEMLGTLALVSSSESRVYGPGEVRLAEELALRAALAIENARLYREAKRATRAREEILGIVAHDLRNPLGTITLQAGFLRRTGSGDRQYRLAADAIARAASRMNRLIQDLLDVTRIDSGHLAIEQTAVQTAELIADALDAQESLASAASIAVLSDVTPGLPEVWGDRDRLLQVFENLTGNAIKFTKAGGRITIGAAPRDGDVLFWVADTGAGISEQDLPHVFDEFWQAANAKRAGAGLGLPIVKGIVEAHGGRVWIESTLGRGTIFFFTIPTAARAEQWRPQQTT